MLNIFRRLRAVEKAISSYDIETEEEVIGMKIKMIEAKIDELAKHFGLTFRGGWDMRPNISVEKDTDAINTLRDTAEQK